MTGVASSFLMRRSGQFYVRVHVSAVLDIGRTLVKFAVMAEMVGALGRRTTIEPTPSLTVGDLPTALATVRHVGRRDFRLLIDMMHGIRSGATVADVAALDPVMIGYVQLCDAPLVPRFES